MDVIPPEHPPAASAPPVIVWLRRDLRLSDQAAFAAAAREGPVIPVYVLDDEAAGDRRMGAASRWWLHHSLESLDQDLRRLGSRLVLRRGRCVEELAAIRRETGARVVHCLRHYEPWWRTMEKAVGQQLRMVCHDGNYLVPPGMVTSGTGTPYKIFTPFWRALLQHMPPAMPEPAPARIEAPGHWPVSDTLADWKLLPTAPDWAGGLRREWTPGEEGARVRLADFVEEAACYDGARNLPAVEGTSRLSPHLHFGELSPAAVWHAVDGHAGAVDVFLTQLGWRDYAQNVILQLPDYGTRHGRAQFDRMQWRTGAEAAADLKAWQQGRTGYPIVDAGMRQLWSSGWMHNRVRMIVSSFLIKHLLIDWREGERWFWDTLVDADYGSNTVSWQWSAGTGIDANMFGRIMAPLSQSARFDAADYIREWVPELAGLSDGEIHDPLVRPNGYPARIVEHGPARARALAAGALVRA